MPLLSLYGVKEEKYPAFVFKRGFAVEFWYENRNISFSA